jgi:hypothetical protein
MFRVTQQVHQNLYNHGWALGIFLKLESMDVSMLGVLAFSWQNRFRGFWRRSEGTDEQQELTSRQSESLYNASWVPALFQRSA